MSVPSREPGKASLPAVHGHSNALIAREQLLLTVASLLSPRHQSMCGRIPLSNVIDARTSAVASGDNWTQAKGLIKCSVRIVCGRLETEVLQPEESYCWT